MGFAFNRAGGMEGVGRGTHTRKNRQSHGHNPWKALAPSTNMAAVLMCMLRMIQEDTLLVLSGPEIMVIARSAV